MENMMALKSSSNLRATSDAGPVSRILYGVAAADGHSSRPSIAGRLQRPTRRLSAPSRHALKTACAVSIFLPIWSCSVWGLPCPVHYCPGGALLPHLFTLTSSLRSRRYVFCGTFRRTRLNAPSRTLSGTLLCGVRTFLSLPAQPEENSSVRTKTATIQSGVSYTYYRMVPAAGWIRTKRPVSMPAKVLVTFVGPDCMMLPHFCGPDLKQASIYRGNDSNQSAFLDAQVTYNRRSRPC